MKKVSITLAKIIGDTVFNHDKGTVESRYESAYALYPKQCDIIIENRKEVLSCGDFESATEFSINLIS